jgi:hypothetical protein
MAVFGFIMLIGVVVDFMVKLFRNKTMDLGNIALAIYLMLSIPYFL